MLSVVVPRAVRGWSLGVGLIMLAAALVLGVSLVRLPDGADGSNAANHALTAVMFLGPLTAGLSATVAGQDARDGQHDLARSTPRGRLGAVLAVALGALLWGAAAHAAMLLTVWSRSTNWIVRPADASLVLAAWSLLLVCAVAGGCVGAWMRSPRAGLWAAAVMFATLYGGGYLEVWSARLTTVYPGTAYPIFLQPNAAMISGKAIITTATAATVLSVMVRRRRWAIVAGSVCAAALGTVLVLNAPDWPAVPISTDEAVCDQDRGFTVCAWPQHADRTGQVIDGLLTLQAQVGHVYPLPTVYRENGAGDPASDDVMIGSLPDPGRPLAPGQAASNLAGHTLPKGPCPDEMASKARDQLSQWLYQSTSQFAPAPTASASAVASWVQEVARCQQRG